MKYISATNPTWANAEKTQIYCFVEFEDLGIVAFTACQNDTAEHGREIFARCLAGEFGEVLPCSR